MRARCLVVLFLLGGGATAFAQSLGQAAQKEKEKRAARAKESKPDSTAPKVITEEDLEASRPAEAPPKSDASGGQAGASSGGHSYPPAFGVADPYDRAQQEKTWRGRAAGARQLVRTMEMLLQAEEEEAHKAAYWAWDTQVPIRPVPKLAGLEGARSALEKAKRQLEELEEEARRKGIPPGWLR